MHTLNRRGFLKHSGAALGGLLLPRECLSCDQDIFVRPAPSSLARIATWWQQTVRAEPDHRSQVVTYLSHDEVIPIYSAIDGTAPWPSNVVWYQTDGGYIHSGYVHPSEDSPSSEVVADVDAPGFWAEVCVPIGRARHSPESEYTARKLYYGTVYRVVGAEQDAHGEWWYRLQEGITLTPGPYLPANNLRRITPEELAPISPERTDKRIEINIDVQLLTCYEGNKLVFFTRIGSGHHNTATPHGEFSVLFKRHAQRMIGGEGEDYYDLPGIAFPTYFTYSGVAIHGTYWHNDYGRRHSHGCVNVTNAAARWVFRWATPVAPYETFRVNAADGSGTRILVV